MVFDVPRNEHRIDLCGRFDPVLFAPRKELCDGLCVGRAGVPVADASGEEFNEAPDGSFTGTADYRRQLLQAGALDIAGRNRKEAAAHGS